MNLCIADTILCYKKAEEEANILQWTWHEWQYWDQSWI